MISPQTRVLVIKHGALGDFVLATGPFAAIRQAHIRDTVVLLTTLLAESYWNTKTPKTIAGWAFHASIRPSNF